MVFCAGFHPGRGARNLAQVGKREGGWVGHSPGGRLCFAHPNLPPPSHQPHQIISWENLLQLPSVRGRLTVPPISSPCVSQCWSQPRFPSVAADPQVRHHVSCRRPPPNPDASDTSCLMRRTSYASNALSSVSLVAAVGGGW